MKNLAFSVLLFILAITNSCKKGPEGPEGATGPAGPAGPTATSGTIVKVLDFTAGPGGGTGTSTLDHDTPVVPPNCRTAVYKAGVGEAAVINMNGSLSTTQIYNGSLFIHPYVKVGASAFAPLNSPVTSFGNFSDGSATAGVTAYTPLTEGTDYIFGTAFASSAIVTIIIAKSSCNCTVTIVKL